MDDQPDATTENTGVQIQTQPKPKPKEQPSNPNPSKHDGSGVTQMDSPNEEMLVEVTYVAKVGKEVNFEPMKPQSQSKSRKWKTQARDSNHTTKMTSGPTSVKRSCSELDWPSPESKRLKNVNPQKTPISPKLKLAWETKGKADENDTVQQMEKSVAKAGS
ncbi:hypothetical protein WN944_018799 [Citrus x changshan-huyou]|uniref:Uncharacterized protein n=1 Tax=Citrus x changshan-huyou TaxID=2935761 RepID=A0AAP0LXF7_9ROSI